MLKIQEAAQDADALSEAPVGQPRVTPEELSRALAAIETRRQAEASHIAGTIPIDQAVSELHLDSTPAEIWVEVQAQRAKAAAAQREQLQREQMRQAQTMRRTQAAQEQSFSPRPRRRWRAGFLAPIVLVWALFHAGVIPHNLGGYFTHPDAPILSSLSQAPSGKEVYADDAALAQVSAGKALTQITVSENATGNRWGIVKIGAHIYLHGYIASTDSLQSLQGRAFNVYNNDNSGELHGETTSNITLRVDKIPLQKSGGDDDYLKIIVPDFQPDPLTTLSSWR